MVCKSVSKLNVPNVSSSKSKESMGCVKEFAVSLAAAEEMKL